jgi:hypothetical protein
MSMLQLALADGRRGFSQIPLAPNAKRPPSRFVWRPYQARRPTIAELHSWFAPGAMNRGIVTGTISGLVVLDADCEDAMKHVLTRWPTPMQTLTASGKRHFFYAHPGVPVRNGVRRLGQPLDVRGDGGYVVAPGSVIDGRRYEALGDWNPASLPTFEPTWIQPAPCCAPAPPPVARDTILEGSIRNVRSYLRRIPSVEGQNGSRGLMRVCYVLVGQGYDFGRAKEELAAWNSEVPVGPWTERELVRALTNAFRRTRGDAQT